MNRCDADMTRVLVSAVTRRGVPTDLMVMGELGRRLPSIARLHRVAPAVFGLLSEVGDAPDQVLTALKVDAAAQAVTRLRMAADLTWLAGTFDSVGVTWAVFKGPVLDQRWPRPGMRQFHDLDVLISPEAFADTLDALEASGARLLDRNWPLLAERRYAEMSLCLPHGTLLDLHWSPMWDARRRRAVPFSANRMLARAQPVVIDGTATHSFDPEDTLLHTATHAASAGAHRLSWIKDVQVCATHPSLDWSVVMARADELGLRLLLALMLTRVERVLPEFSAPDDAVRAARGPWGRVAALMDRRYPVPATRQRQRTGGHLYTSTGPSTAASLAAAIGSAHRVSARTRPIDTSPEPDPLRLDRPDQQARRNYLVAVTSGADA